MSARGERRLSTSPCKGEAGGRRERERMTHEAGQAAAAGKA